jgi:hypothetical protein
LKKIYAQFCKKFICLILEWKRLNWAGFRKKREETGVLKVGDCSVIKASIFPFSSFNGSKTFPKTYGVWFRKSLIFVTNEVGAEKLYSSSVVFQAVLFVLVVLGLL